MTRNLDHIGIGLGHTSRDRPDPNFSNQLHTDRGFGMHLVQIVDELSQIFNGIDVVVGRRRNQRHSSLAVTQPSDVLIHLWPRQLAAFTRLSPLSHLDLELLTAAQILRCHPKPARSNLLNR